MLKRKFAAFLAALTLTLAAGTAAASGLQTPLPPWGPDDEAGNSNTQGYSTYFRAALQMLRPGAKAYRLAHLFSGNMPQSPFAAPWEQTSNPTAFIPPFLHAANSEIISGDIGNQGTQMDSLGHFGYKPDANSDEVLYYNGFTQEEVKGPDGLLKLGIEKSKPIVT
ncbi:cyclase family protein, partial [bacterium]